MPIQTVDVQTQPASLKELVALAQMGTEIILTDGVVPLARIVPIEKPLVGRVFDLHPGAIQIGDDFDDELPDEFWLGADSGAGR